MPKVSIITVTYNAVSFVEETILSVLGQDFHDYEYLVVDGGSTDGTLEILKKYEGWLHFISEPDKGIYDAMNKGIARSTGEWLYFLNAGDAFYSPGVLGEIFTEANVQNNLLIYGDVRTRNHPTGVERTIGHAVDISSFYYRVGLCHQAAFTHRSAFDKFGNYNGKDFPILADQEWFVRFFQGNSPSIYLHRTIAYYEVVGESYKKRLQNHHDHLRIVAKHFPARVRIINALRNPWVLLKIWLLSHLATTRVYAWYRRLFFSR